MENIKEKVNKFFKLYVFYMLLAICGSIAYILITLSLYYSFGIGIILGILIFAGFSFYIYQHVQSKKVNKPIGFVWLDISKIIYSSKTQQDIFEPLVGDWHAEIFEALQKDRNANLFMINVRYTYIFIETMWQKSPIGDLIEFVKKIAK